MERQSGASDSLHALAISVADRGGVLSENRIGIGVDKVQTLLALPRHTMLRRPARTRSIILDPMSSRQTGRLRPKGRRAVHGLLVGPLTPIHRPRAPHRGGGDQRIENRVWGHLVASQGPTPQNFRGKPDKPEPLLQLPGDAEVVEAILDIRRGKSQLIVSSSSTSPTEVTDPRLTRRGGLKRRLNRRASIINRRAPHFFFYKKGATRSRHVRYHRIMPAF